MAKTDKTAKADAKGSDKEKAATDAKPPQPGDGPKSATRNEAPANVEPAAPPRDVKPPVPQDAPPPGSGPKSATHNEPPTEPDARARVEARAEGDDRLVREDRADLAARAPVAATADVGAPPAVPGTVEDPTHMPGPLAIPTGSPADPALPPGQVPPGDSRSFRRGGEFALVYRQGNAVIMRFGTVGQRGQWRVVEYPTTSSASHAYAKECSRFVAEGFSDYR